MIEGEMNNLQKLVDIGKRLHIVYSNSAAFNNAHHLGGKDKQQR